MLTLRFFMNSKRRALKKAKAETSGRRHATQNRRMRNRGPIFAADRPALYLPEAVISGTTKQGTAKI
ncbi:hypothetical protein [Caballeronia sordidicola]|jgi:hypothetical protein|uniref:hypothetical protein n=1 Tax=Caballeronia sordidicola TaxID=196367 RepID=UPI000A3847B6|nr:hypothetical protein [Caballeronia sordidicola]